MVFGPKPDTPERGGGSTPESEGITVPSTPATSEGGVSPVSVVSSVLISISFLLES